MIREVDIAIQVVAQVCQFLFDLGDIESCGQWFIRVCNTSHAKEHWGRTEAEGADWTESFDCCKKKTRNSVQSE